MGILKNRLLENICSLGIIKGLQYVLAFITFPYLVRVLEVDGYGMLVFAQGIIQYFVLFTDYGFNLLAPREIARHDSPRRRGKVFAGIFGGKVLLLLLSTIVFVVWLFVGSVYTNLDACLYSVLYITVVGNVLFPVWFFQGIQQMRYITVVNVLARFFSVIGIFCFVRDSEDYIIAAFCQSAVPLLAAIFSWIILLIKYQEVLVVPSYDNVKGALAEGWSIFTSTVAINLYTASNVVFLGLLTNNTVVGYFSGAKKIIDNVLQLISPVTQAIYPHVSKKAAESKADALAFLRKVILLLGGSNFLLSAVIFIFAEWVINILLGSGYEQSILLLRIMAFCPFMISMSNIFGIQTMLTFGMQREFNRILISAAVFNTCLVLPMIYFFAAEGVSVTVMLTETMVTLVMWFVLRKHAVKLI